MAIVGETRSERRAIVESVGLAATGQFNLPIKGVDVPPPVEDHTLFGREVNGHGVVVSMGSQRKGGGVTFLRR